MTAKRKRQKRSWPRETSKWRGSGLATRLEDSEDRQGFVMDAKSFGLASVPTSLKIGRVIRSGFFGLIYEGKLHGVSVAIRVIHPSLLQGERRNSKIVEEALLMKQLSHPHIVKIIEVYFSKEDGPILVMERMYDNLANHLELNRDKLSRKRQIDICLQIADAVHYLHSQQPPVVRRNLSPIYILLSEDGRTVKLGGCMGFFVNPLYWPPEKLVEDAHYDEKIDIYSLGVVMLQVATQRDAEDLSFLPEDHPLKPIILQCLRDDPGERPDSGAVFRMLSEGETMA